MGSRQEKETADYHAELQPLPQGPGEYWILGGYGALLPDAPCMIRPLPPPCRLKGGHPVLGHLG